jgi:hypothetical protein
MAGIVAALPTQTFASASQDNNEDDIFTTYTSYSDDEDSSGEEYTVTSTCTINDDDGIYTITVVDENGEEQTYEFSSDEDIEKIIGSATGDITINREINVSDSDDEVYVCSEYVIDDGEDDGIENSATYTFTESDNGKPVIIDE